MQMTSSIVRGMPYGTMRYAAASETDSSGQVILPSIVCPSSLLSMPVVDQGTQMDCSSQAVISVEREIVLTFQSGLTWMIFVSRPTQMQCSESESAFPFILQVADSDTSPLTLRVALIMAPDTRISGSNVSDTTFATNYQGLLRQYADIYAGDYTDVAFSFDGSSPDAKVYFDWNPQNMNSSGSSPGLIMFAMPHHWDIIQAEMDFCTPSLFGPVCVVKGNAWVWDEAMAPGMFTAPRHPAPQFLPNISAALQDDLLFTLTSNYQIGAGDTYFSGKMLGKLARILLIAEEVQELCANATQNPNNIFSGFSGSAYVSACSQSVLPTDTQRANALAELRVSLDIWINGSAEAPFVYDESWGGVVSCGCNYNNGFCTNTLPNCPSFSDQGLNFGNGMFLEVAS